MTKFIIAFFSLFMLMASPALAVDVLSGCDNAGSAANSSVCQDRASQKTDGTNPVNRIIHIAANIVAVLTGTVAIIMIIVSAFKFSAGGASPESVKSARSTLIAAIIGLAIISLAWTIISVSVDRLITN